MNPVKFRTTCLAKVNHPRFGAAAVETALILPVLLTLVLGAVDFGRVLGLSAELDNAVRIGAESGATHMPTSLTYDSWLARINTVMLDDLSATKDFNMSNVTIKVSLLTDAQGFQQVQVTANYLFTTIVNWPYMPTKVPLQSQLVMRQYR